MWKTIQKISGGIGALMLVMITVQKKDAISNLSSWFEWTGFNLGWLEYKSADTIGLIVGLGFIFVSILMLCRRPEPFKVTLLEGYYDPKNPKSVRTKTSSIVGIHDLWGPYTVEIKSRIKTTIEEINLRFVRWYFYKDRKFCKHHDVDKEIIEIMEMQDPYKHNVREPMENTPNNISTKKAFQMWPDNRGGQDGKYIPEEKSPRGHKIWYQLSPPHVHIDGKYKLKISLKHKKGGGRTTYSRKKLKIIHRTVEQQLKVEKCMKAFGKHKKTKHTKQLEINAEMPSINRSHNYHDNISRISIKNLSGSTVKNAEVKLVSIVPHPPNITAPLPINLRFTGDDRSPHQIYKNIHRDDQILVDVIMHRKTLRREREWCLLLTTLSSNQPYRFDLDNYKITIAVTSENTDRISEDLFIKFENGRMSMVMAPNESGKTKGVRPGI